MYMLYMVGSGNGAYKGAGKLIGHVWGGSSGGDDLFLYLTEFKGNQSWITRFCTKRLINLTDFLLCGNCCQTLHAVPQSLHC